MWREEGDPPTECYCCWLAGVGGMPPCSYCTSGAGDEEEEEPQETDGERYDRVMKELLGRP